MRSNLPRSVVWALAPVVGALVALPLLVSPAASGEETGEIQRPNVLFVISDDLAAHALGCGGGDCKTPTIDTLARRGLMFERAYTQFPACGPSRASLMSGMYPRSLGILSNYQAAELEERLGSRPTLPELFRASGWHTARSGKIFHMQVPAHIREGAHGDDHAESWTERHSVRGPEWTTEGFAEAFIPWGRRASQDAYYGTAVSYVRASGSGAEQADSLAADRAIEILGQPRDQPLFLAVGFVRPHAPLVAPEAHFERHPVEAMTLPTRLEGDQDDIPAPSRGYDLTDAGLSDEDSLRRALSAYCASVSFMDEQLGRILSALRGRGMEENTIVVFTADHGHQLGEHGYWGKSSLREEVVRVPLLIAGPGIAPGRTRALAELVDLYPTLAELAGLEIPEHVEGRSLVPIVRDNGAAVRGAAYSTRVAGDLLRTDRWAFYAWRDRSTELFDMLEDPEQLTNLTRDPEYRSVKRRLRRALAERAAADSTDGSTGGSQGDDQS